MIRVVLVHILSDFCLAHDFSQNIIDSLEISRILRRREELKDLENLYLKPRARSLIVIVISCMLVDICQNLYQLRNKDFKSLSPHRLNGSINKSTRCH
jgi:ERCC4-related helicase